MKVVESSNDCKNEDKHLPFYCCQNCYYVYRTKEEFESSHSKCIIRNLKDSRFSESNFVPSQYFDISDLIQSHNRFICAYCLEEFRNFLRVNFHIKQCNGGPPFSCALCSKTFQVKKDLNSHKEIMHADDKPFKCPYCSNSAGASFKRNSSLQKHLIKKHETPQNESYKCDKCPKRFIKKVYLTHHKTRFHNTTKPFLCQNCGESLLSKSSLREHMKMHAPTLEKTPCPSKREQNMYPCHYCEKSFKRKDKLDFHISVHTGKKPFVCHLCSR